MANHHRVITIARNMPFTKENLKKAFNAFADFASKSTIIMSAASTVIGTGLYVGYKDWVRDRRMMER